MSEQELVPAEPTPVEKLQAKGLTEDEAVTLVRYIENGKPGLSKFRAEKLSQIYFLGYSCQEIQNQFPEFPLEVILWARVHYSWDEARHKYLIEVEREAIRAATQTRLESMLFLSDIVRATHKKWRKQVLDYIADPQGQEPPKFLPDNIYNYGQLLTTLDNLVTPKTGGRGKDESASNPLVSVNIKSTGNQRIQVSPSDVKEALREELGEPEEE